MMLTSCMHALLIKILEVVDHQSSAIRLVEFSDSSKCGKNHAPSSFESTLTSWKASVNLQSDTILLRIVERKGDIITLASIWHNCIAIL